MCVCVSMCGVWRCAYAQLRRTQTPERFNSVRLRNECSKQIKINEIGLGGRVRLLKVKLRRRKETGVGSRVQEEMEKKGFLIFCPKLNQESLRAL